MKTNCLPVSARSLACWTITPPLIVEQVAFLLYYYTSRCLKHEETNKIVLFNLLLLDSVSTRSLKPVIIQLAHVAGAFPCQP